MAPVTARLASSLSDEENTSMSPVIKKLIPATVAIVLAGGLLAGCENNMDLEPQGSDPEAAWTRFWALGDWKQMPEPYKNHVEVVQMGYRVSFPSGAANLDQQDLSDLHGFLREQGVTTTDGISIAAPRTITGQFGPLTTNRISQVAGELARVGLRVSVSTSGGEEQSLANDELLVTVSRHVVLSPNCENEDPEVGERPEYYWTCATTANLGAMVADPRDLARGQTPNPADGEAMALGTQRYRKGEPTPLIDESTGGL
jgi:pilus biogenesis lipoprotein CpaD